MANKTLSLRAEIYDKLKRLAKFRNISLQELILEFLETIDDAEQNEIAFNEYIK